MRHIGTITAACIVLAFLASGALPIKQTESWCDPVSGSMKWQTVWPLGITVGPRIDISPLDSRLRSIGYHWTPAWKGLHNVHRTLWGRAVEYECGSAPTIYHLGPVLDGYAKAASAEELRRFADTMQSGTDQEQQAAVDQAGSKGLAFLAADRTGR